MTLKKTIYVLLLLLLNPIYGKTQQADCFDKLPSEKVILNLDKNVYLAGDSIWFKAYCLQANDKISTLSQILYIELYNENKEVLIQQKFKFSNGKTWGAIPIPEAVKTGHYFLRGYTQYLRNFSVKHYYNQYLSIINPALEHAVIVEKPIGFEKQSEQASRMNVSVQDISKIISPEIQGLKTAYKQRSSVELQIDFSGVETASLSVVVRKKGLGINAEERVPAIVLKNPGLSAAYIVNTGMLPKTSIEAIENTLSKFGNPFVNETDFLLSNKDQKLKFLPEINQLNLSGIVRDRKTKEPVQSILCMASVIGEKAKMHLATSREDGSFIFGLSQLEGDQNLFVGMKDSRNKELELLVNNDFSNDFPEVSPVPLLFDAARHSLIEGLFLEKQLKQNFKKASHKNAYPPIQSIDSKSNIGQPDITIKLSEFIKIPTMPEIFEEIIPGVSLRKKAGRTYLNIYNGEEQRGYDDPIVLLDNVPVYDIGKLMKIDPTKVDRIEVINTYYILGDYMLDGLVMLHTKTDDFAKYQWDNESVFVNYKTISRSPSFQQSVYRTSSKKGRSPDFRNTLYWNPDVEIDNSGVSLEFYTSDMTGLYEIIIQGYTKDGRRCYGSATFEVGRE